MLYLNIGCEPSVESSYQDGSNEVSQLHFMENLNRSLYYPPDNLIFSFLIQKETSVNTQL